MKPSISLALLLLAIAGCGHVEPLLPRTAADPEVRRLDVGGGTNAFVVMGARPILVDTGWGAKSDQLEHALAEIKINPHDLSLIVLTHGHGDHAGGAKRMRELSGAKILVGQPDAEMVAAGHNRPMKPMSFMGRLIRGYSDKPFPPFTADLSVSNEFDLAPYGVDGKVVVMPGHTPGSLVVILPTGDAIVGDMLRGGTFRSESPERHFFHDDCAAAEAHIDPLVRAGSKRLFVGHGGPIEGKAAREEFRDNPCPK